MRNWLQDQLWSFSFRLNRKRFIETIEKIVREYYQPVIEQAVREGREP